MSDYLLFIDTEATDLPKNWTLPFDSPGNWPHALQISWVIYNKDRTEIKREDHYIRVDNDVEISDGALKVHGITKSFLQQHGEQIDTVLQLFIADMDKFKPLLIGHFVKLDYHVLAVELYRAGMSFNFDDTPMFCTMITSDDIAQNYRKRQLKLDELYNLLFYKDPVKPHNALYDAHSAADCFFELTDRGEITAKIIERQNKQSYNWRRPIVKQKNWLLPVILVVIICVIIYCIL
ncbi:MAG: 3'-5' exonuclease [Mucilaginibacter sp.]